MRRGAFLERLRKLLREPPVNPVALVVANVDQADEIQERLSLSSCHELEQAVAWRLAHHFAPNDRYGLIREFGFGTAYSVLAALALWWVFPYSLATVRDGRWLTR